MRSSRKKARRRRPSLGNGGLGLWLVGLVLLAWSPAPASAATNGDACWSRYCKKMRTVRYCSKYRDVTYCSGYRDERYCAKYRDERYCSKYRTESYCARYATRTVCARYATRNVCASYGTRNVCARYATRTVCARYATRNVCASYGTRNVCSRYATRTVCASYAYRRISYCASYTRQRYCSSYATRTVCASYGSRYESYCSRYSYRSIRYCSRTSYRYERYCSRTSYRYERYCSRRFIGICIRYSYRRISYCSRYSYRRLSYCSSYSYRYERYCSRTSYRRVYYCTRYTRQTYCARYSYRTVCARYAYRYERYCSRYTSQRYCAAYRSETYCTRYTSQRYCAQYRNETYCAQYRSETYCTRYTSQRYCAQYRNETYCAQTATRNVCATYATRKVCDQYATRKVCSAYAKRKECSAYATRQECESWGLRNTCSKCPTSCKTDADCYNPDCGNRTHCVSGKCVSKSVSNQCHATNMLILLDRNSTTGTTYIDSGKLCRSPSQCTDTKRYPARCQRGSLGVATCWYTQYDTIRKALKEIYADYGGTSTNGYNDRQIRFATTHFSSSTWDSAPMVSDPPKLGSALDIYTPYHSYRRTDTAMSRAYTLLSGYRSKDSLKRRPQMVLLITNGYPRYGCSTPASYARSIYGLKDGSGAPSYTKTHVLGLGYNHSCLRDIANAGKGKYFYAATAAGIKDALQNVVLEALKERCDGLDNNCNGQIDDGTTDGDCACVKSYSKPSTTAEVNTSSSDYRSNGVRMYTFMGYYSNEGYCPDYRTRQVTFQYKQSCRNDPTRSLNCGSSYTRPDSDALPLYCGRCCNYRSNSNPMDKPQTWTTGYAYAYGTGSSSLESRSVTRDYVFTAPVDGNYTIALTAQNFGYSYYYTTCLDSVSFYVGDKLLGNKALSYCRSRTRGFSRDHKFNVTQYLKAGEHTIRLKLNGRTATSREYIRLRMIGNVSFKATQYFADTCTWPSNHSCSNTPWSGKSKQSSSQCYASCKSWCSVNKNTAQNCMMQYGKLKRIGSGYVSGRLVAQTEVDFGQVLNKQSTRMLFVNRPNTDYRGLATDSRPVLATVTPNNYALPTAISRGTIGGSNHSFTTNNTKLTAAMMGIHICDNSKECAKERQDLIAMVRGYDDTGKGVRVNRLGPIHHSSPVVHTAPQDSVPSGDFNNWRNSSISLGKRVKDRPPVVYVGSNDGIFHAFHAQTGLELWGYMPKTTLSRLRTSLNGSMAGGGNVYTVDGTAVVQDVRMYRYAVGSNVSAKWRTVAIFGFGAGGRGYTALDVTDPYKPRLLWEINNESYKNPANRALGKFDRMGYTTAKPMIANVLINWPDARGSTRLQERAVAFLAGGVGITVHPTPPIYTLSPNDPKQGGVMYVVDLETGVLIREFKPNDPGRGIAVGKEAPMTGTPVGFGIAPALTTRVFSADVQGRIFRIDTQDTNPNNWKLRLFYDLFSPGNNNNAKLVRRPVMVSPSLAMNNRGELVLYGGTGNLLNIGTVSGINKIFSLRENFTYGSAIDAINGRILPDKVVTISNYVVSLNKNSKRVNGVPSQETVSSKTTGEKITGTPVIYDGTAYFTTYTPNSVDTPVCGVSGFTRFYGIHFDDLCTTSACWQALYKQKRLNIAATPLRCCEKGGGSGGTCQSRDQSPWPDSSRVNSPTLCHDLNFTKPMLLDPAFSPSQYFRYRMLGPNTLAMGPTFSYQPGQTTLALVNAGDVSQGHRFTENFKARHFVTVQVSGKNPVGTTAYKLGAMSVIGKGKVQAASTFGPSQTQTKVIVASWGSVLE